MRSSGSFSFLLAALLFALAQVEGAPVTQPPCMVTMPLKRLPQRSDIHPSILLQQHINRGHRRYARMNGLPAPSDALLLKRLEKRVNQANFEKRYNRNGINPVLASDDFNVTVTGSNPNSNDTVPNDNNPNSTSQGFPQGAVNPLLDGNGIAITPANQPTTPNSLGLDIEGRDIGYIATVQLGTPPRNFSVIMDSGSSDFWVGGEGCQSEVGGGCGDHVFLGSNSSSSFQDSGKLFQVTYGAGQVTGSIINDNVNIAGLALDQHTFGVALVESPEFSNQTLADGLMGLAQSPLSNQGVLTPVESLAKQGLISEAITSYKISRVSDGLNDGEITFGGLDESKFDPNSVVTVDNVNPQGFWEAPFSVAVDGQDLGLVPRTAVLDTGTTLILAPPADAAALHAQIPGSKSDGQGGYIIPCTTNSVVSMTFGGKSFDINTSDLLFAPLTNDLQGDCASSISAVQFNGPQQWLVGDVFLKNAYFSTDVNKNTITLAKLV